MVKLTLKECSYSLAKKCVEKYHYSHNLPTESLLRLAVYEEDKLIGVVVYARGANKNKATPFGLSIYDICELIRVALNEHRSPVTQIISESIKILKKKFPKIKMIISFADSNQSHLGVIYQAGNWIYTGYSKDTEIIVNGVQTHRRSLYDKYGTSSLKIIKKTVDPHAKRVFCKQKYRYVYPLNKQLRKRILKMSKKYPKKIK